MRPFTPPQILGIAAMALAGTVEFHGADSTVQKISPDQSAFFENHIRPVLVAECVECHGADKQKGGLRLDYRDGWKKGGDSGAAILPGDPEKSLLLRTMRHLEPDMKMPDKAPKLDDAIIDKFNRWIAMGAPDPRDAPPQTGATKPSWPDMLASRRSWWSLQPIATPLPPRATTQTAQSAFKPATDSPADIGTAHPVDLFLNDSIAKAGLVSAPAATPATVARRLHFILTGLPPSAQSIKAFEVAWSQSRGNAVETLANSLLASPTFGEHWARHWMDLVRYAESHGSEGDPEIPSAYQYRDYLIRAFNTDLPLSSLIREHIAGDLLSPQRISPEGLNESRIGPAHFRMAEHGFQPVDTLDDQIKAVDNQIDVVTKAFQGLTVSCARCHDHKFDAISQNDYTALYGIFSSVRAGQVVLNSDASLKLSKKADLMRIKTELKAEFASLWLSQTETLPAALIRQAHPPEEPDIENLRKRLASLDSQIAEKSWARISAGPRAVAVMPYAIWSFAHGPNDLLGRLQSELKGDAEVKDGALILSGKGAFLQTGQIPDTFKERALEAWVATDDLEQHGGGIVGIEQVSNHNFDSIVFGEKQRRKWLPGSNNFKRTEQPEGPEETASSKERIHLAISFAIDGTIAMFRNGIAYGAPYRKDTIHEYPAGDSRLLIGLRHAGASNGFFKGRIEEVRLYNRALTPEEVASSFVRGPVAGRVKPLHEATKPAGADLQKNVDKATGNPALDEKADPTNMLVEEAKKLRDQITLKTSHRESNPLFKAAAPQEHPLHLALKAVTLSPADFSRMQTGYRARMQALIQEAETFNKTGFEHAWDLSDPAEKPWFFDGPDIVKTARGDFRLSKDGPDAFAGLLPAGVAASTLVPHLGGNASSPDFQIKKPNISVRFAATNGAMLRVIPDNYPLGSNSIFPRAIVQRSQSAWSRLDCSYRLGCNGYVELTTPPHQTRRADNQKNAGPQDPEDSFFVVEKVVFHEGNVPPREEHPALALVLSNCHATDPKEYLTEFGNLLRSSVTSWQAGTLSEAQRQLLDICVQGRLLDTQKDASPTVAKLVEEYRATLAQMPKPSMVPGVLEHEGRDAPFLARGDHKKPGNPVQRAFLEVLDPNPIKSTRSGRLELADRILSVENPLTARVMANRIWHWTFGTGIVPTVDNFGRMGDKPSHPELLDYLASKLQQDRWSLKKSLLFLVTTDAFQRTSTPSDAATQKDPANALLSHAHVRRLDAEPIRDSLLSVAGALETKLYGPPVGVEVPRRSIYVHQRRNNLPALLTTFDAPKPFTTLGRRDITTVPAQSLTLLNDPGIVKLAGAWAQKTNNAGGTLEAKIGRMFITALGREATPTEMGRARDFLAASGTADDLALLAHALFNLKEFIYLK